jgi:hypothetical protein
LLPKKIAIGALVSLTYLYVSNLYFDRNDIGKNGNFFSKFPIILKGAPSDTSNLGSFFEANIEPAGLPKENPIWIARYNSTSSLFFGTNKDNLSCISQQSADSYVLKNLDLNTTYYWYETGELQCYIGQIAYWWSSTVLGGIEIGFNQAGAYNYHIYDKKDGFSIRCIKDNN